MVDRRSQKLQSPAYAGPQVARCWLRLSAKSNVAAALR